MPRSSRHKLRKHSKHSSKDYSDSEEDVVKMKEKSSKNKDSTSAEKRKISSQVLDSKDLSGHGNGEVSEDYVSTKRRKAKSGVNVGSDRWNGGGDERGDSDSNMDSEMRKGESLRTESKSKSKRHGTGSAGEKKEDNLMMEREESKSKGESRRKSERDSSSVRKEGKELKDKERRSEKEKEKEKNGGQESQSGDAAVKVVDRDVRKKQGSQLGDFSEERQGKHAREHSERTVLEELQNPELEKEAEKRIRRRREGSSERDKQYDDSIKDDERLLSSRGDRAKDVKFRDDKLKDGSHADKYQEDSRKDDKRRDEKYHNEADKDNKHQDDKYREDGEKNARRRVNKYREDGDRDNRRKDEKDRDYGERDYRRKDGKYRQGIAYDDQRVDKNHEDGNKNSRRKDGRYVEGAENDIKYVDERYHDDGDRDDRRRDNYYKGDGSKDHRREEEKYRDDIERQNRHKNSKQGGEFDREKRMKDAKYRDELTSRERSDERPDHKRSRDDGYAAEHHSRKSSVYDNSPARDDRTAKHRDDEVRRRIDEKDDYGDTRSRGTRDQRSDAEKKSSTGARMEQVTDRVQNRRQSSPTTSSHTPRDHYRVQKQDESKYRDYNYEARVRHTISAGRDYSGAVGSFEKTPSRSLEKFGTNDDDHLGGLSAERRLKSDIRSSPLRFVDKSPSSSNDRRQFSKSDLRRSVGVEESAQRSGGSRDTKEFSEKEGRGSRDPGDESLPADADTISVSSPFSRNSHFSSSSKSLAPPPLFRAVDSPLLSGSVEDDGRGKSSIRHRRIVDPNMGRIQGNAWRGIPSWPSPVGNGFLPFPHGPPPVSFHSVLPFPAPPMFGVRPSMDLSHPAAPYLMPGADRFSGPGRPMGWRNQVDDSCPPLHSWDASNPVFGDDSHMYGRSDWDHSRDLPDGRRWGSSDLLGGPNKNATSEMPFSENGNNSVRNGDEALSDESNPPSKNEPAPADQQVKSIDISQSTKNSGRNDVDAPPVTSQETRDVKMMSRADDGPICHVYLLKFDISSDLTEAECFSKCSGLIDVDRSICSDVDGAKTLYMEGGSEANLASDKLLNDTMFGSSVDSVLQKSMSLYQRLKQNLLAGDGKELNVTSKVPLQLDQGDRDVEDDRTEKLCPIDNMEAVEYGIPMEEDPQQSLEIDQTVSNALKISTEPASSVLVFDQGDLQENNVEEKTLSPLPSEVKDVSMEVAINNEELKLLDTKCGNSDVSSEAIMIPELVNLSRIHHSPESTH